MCIIVYLECLLFVVDVFDFFGLISGIIDYVICECLEKVMFVIECLMVFNIVDVLLDVDFVGLCNMCLYMKKIMFEKILYSLYIFFQFVEVDLVVVDKVCVVVEWMIDLS